MPSVDPTCFERDFIGNMTLNEQLEVSKGDALDISKISDYPIIWNADFTSFEKAKI